MGYYFADFLNDDPNELGQRRTAVQIAVESLKKHEFDFIAARGMSGVAFASIVAYELNKPLVIVRKDGDNTHSVEWAVGHQAVEPEAKYVVVDDFIATGATLSEIKAQITKHIFGECVGFYMYAKPDDDNSHRDGHIAKVRELGSYIPSRDIYRVRERRNVRKDKLKQLARERDAKQGLEAVIETPQLSKASAGRLWVGYGGGGSGGTYMGPIEPGSFCSFQGVTVPSADGDYQITFPNTSPNEYQTALPNALPNGVGYWLDPNVGKAGPMLNEIFNRLMAKAAEQRNFGQAVPIDKQDHFRKLLQAEAERLAAGNKKLSARIRADGERFLEQLLREIHGSPKRLSGELGTPVRSTQVLKPVVVNVADEKVRQMGMTNATLASAGIVTAESVARQRLEDAAKHGEPFKQEWPAPIEDCPGLTQEQRDQGVWGIQWPTPTTLQLPIIDKPKPPFEVGISVNGERIYDSAHGGILKEFPSTPLTPDPPQSKVEFEAEMAEDYHRRSKTNSFPFHN